MTRRLHPRIDHTAKNAPAGPRPQIGAVDFVLVDNTPAERRAVALRCAEYAPDRDVLAELLDELGLRP
jgi:hypothetical protein